jgi:hypothetical protein
MRAWIDTCTVGDGKNNRTKVRVRNAIRSDPPRPHRAERAGIDAARASCLLHEAKTTRVKPRAYYPELTASPYLLYKHSMAAGALRSIRIPSGV